MATKMDARQIISRDLLSQIASTTGIELDDLLRSIDDDLTNLFRLDVSSPADLIITVSTGSVLTNEITGRQRIASHIDDVIPVVSAGETITFPSTSGSNVVFSKGNNTILNVDPSNYIKGLIYLDIDSDFNILFGTQNTVEADANVPKSPTNTLPIGFVVIYNNAGTIRNVETSHIYQFSSSGGGGGGGFGSKEVESASGFGDGSGVTNCTIAVVSDKTRVTLTSFAYNNGLYPNTAFGDVTVLINGQEIERKIAGKNDVIDNIIYEESLDGLNIDIYKVIAGGTQELSNDASISISKVVYSAADLASINGHIIPDTDSIYDLGSTGNKFRDLFLSGNTIHIGDAKIKYDSLSGKLQSSHDGITYSDITSYVAQTLINKTTDYIILDDDGFNTIVVTDTTADRTITLPTAVDNDNRIITIKNFSTQKGSIIVDGEGSETIEGSATFVLDCKYSQITIQCDGSNWYIIDYKFPVKRYSLTISGTSMSNPFGYGYPYRDLDGTWRMKFNILYYNGIGATPSYTVTVSGVTFSSSFTTYGQALTFLDHNILNRAADQFSGAKALPNSSNIITFYSSDTSRDYEGISGDVELESKPTFVE